MDTGQAGTIRLLEVVRQLQGLELPWSELQSSILPRRVSGFSIEMLDALAATGQIAWVGRAPISGNHVFGKDRCGHCVRAKEALERAGIAYTYHDVIKNPRAVYEMVPRAKAEIGEKTPVTTPQVWIDGAYIGGADALEKHLAAA